MVTRFNPGWGIEQFTTAGGRRLVAASDRDHGLFLFEYTGNEPGHCKGIGRAAPAAPRLR